MAEFPYIDIHPEDKLLAALIAKVKADEDCEAICLYSGIAHGYTTRYQIVQFKDSSRKERFLRQQWVDLDEKIENLTTDHLQVLRLNLVEELQKLRRENEQMRVETPYDEEKGRYKFILIALKDDGDWIRTQYPNTEQPLPNTAINRIFAAIHG